MEATSSADASRAPSGWEDNTAPSRGPEDRRDGADGRALGIAAAGVSGKAKTARPRLNSARRRASR